MSSDVTVSKLCNGASSSGDMAAVALPVPAAKVAFLEMAFCAEPKGWGQQADCNRQ